MPFGEFVSRLFRPFTSEGSSSTPTTNVRPNDIGIHVPAAFAASRNRFSAGLERKTAAASRSEFLIGPGADRVRTAQAIIKRLARKQPPSGGIPASVPTRLAVIAEADDRRVVRAPALVTTPVQLRSAPAAASEIQPIVARQLYTIREARRRRTEVESILEKISAGTATLEDRIRLNHVVDDVMHDLKSDPEAMKIVTVLTSDTFRPPQEPEEREK
jgi:hypothetical protein